MFEFTLTVLAPDGQPRGVPCSASEPPGQWSAADLRHVLYEVGLYLGLDGPLLVAFGWRAGGLVVEIGDERRSGTFGPLKVRPEVVSAYHRDSSGDLFELDAGTVH